MSQDLKLLYGIFAYFVFILTIAYSVAFFGNLFVARTIDAAAIVPFGEALAVNFGLLLLFGCQHISAGIEYRHHCRSYSVATDGRCRMVRFRSVFCRSPTTKGIKSSLYLRRDSGAPTRFAKAFDQRFEKLAGK
jgi:hypothetical protein